MVTAPSNITVVLFIGRGYVKGFRMGVRAFLSIFVSRNNCERMLGNLRGALGVTVVNLIVNVVVNALVTIIQILPGCHIFPHILGDVYAFCITFFEKAPVMIRLLLLCCITLPVVKLGLPSIAITVVIFNLGSNTCVSRVVHDNVRSISPKRARNNQTVKLDFSGAVISVMVPRTIGGVLPALNGRFVALVGRASIMDFVNTVSLCITFGGVNSGDCRFVIPFVMVTLVCVMLILLVALLVGLVREDLGGDSENGWFGWVL